MSDLEGLTRNLIKKGYSDSQILDRLVQEYLDFKDIDKNLAYKYAHAIIEECKKSDLQYILEPFIKELLEVNQSNVSVGKQGVGCRGAGDFFVHKLVTDFSETEHKAFLSPTSLDDAGAVRLQDIKGFKKDLISTKDLIIVSKMEGIHSRLSDYPFICGFHVTRAALRDLYVKGAKPISIMIDVHLGDDADVGKLFDFMAGISTVSELTKVPITAGSTLRIGGDMVIGDRLVGGVSAVGLTNRKLLARRNIQVGDVILMTEGAGGGTITTTAIYSGNHDVVKETLNIKFLEACEVILNSDYISEIRAMCDITNGGLRGDLYEINYEANCGVNIYVEKVRNLINPIVLNMLEKVGVDYLGVSLDSLLIYCSKSISDKIIIDLKRKNIKCDEIGYVDDSKQVFITKKGKEKKKILPKFRESAYTKIKQEIGEKAPNHINVMEKNIEKAAIEALKKRKKILEYVKHQKQK
ncbi:MAG: AIR synthase-related protein [Candidatus Hodarchaeota archaeon]